MNLLKTISLTAILLVTSSYAQAPRWAITDSGRSITWKVGEHLPHNDHIEMSGQSISAILRYGVDSSGALALTRHLVWPMLRTVPNDTHASLADDFTVDILSLLRIQDSILHDEKVNQVMHSGLMSINSDFAISCDRVSISRMIFPSTTLPLYCERYLVRNNTCETMTIDIAPYREVRTTDPTKGVDGSYTIISKLRGDGRHTLAPGEILGFSLSIQAINSTQTEIDPDMGAEQQARETLIAKIGGNLVLETPDPVLNTAFRFAKVRAAESIFKTKGGYMHAPGGGHYYAAIWANDQAEYINPFFPFLGYEVGNESAMNSYRHFARFMNPEWKPIPSSIIAEGTDIWNGAGDRGDAAMIAYGAARFALSSGSQEQARELWPLIEWCLEFSRRKINESGVVASDSDELEGRFPTGKANLCTSSLYYDALISAAALARDLKFPAKQAKEYLKQAEQIRAAIEAHFGATVEGFDTYQYYDGNEILRSWICMPLTVGIYDRAEATADALFSPRLWSENGLLTQAGSDTFWDRSTLYALRGVYASGATERATSFLKSYSTTRLLGEHVPYPIEAWPEGDQRHLSAESGLYCRIFTEGMFGIRPTGLNSFTLTPRLPQQWDHMSLRRVSIGGRMVDIEVKRGGDGRMELQVRDNYSDSNFKFTAVVRDSEVVEVKL